MADSKPSSGDPLNHFNAQGAAHMVPISQKSPTPRFAVAQAKISMSKAAAERIASAKIDKGDVLGIARIAGITGAKATSNLIPLCHPVSLTGVDVDFELEVDEQRLTITARVDAVDRTGPDMEAMTAASVAALTVYDMCKAIDKGMCIESVMMLEKSGGRSGHWTRKP